jgi:hypothetical protein
MLQVERARLRSGSRPMGRTVSGPGTRPAAFAARRLPAHPGRARLPPERPTLDQPRGRPVSYEDQRCRYEQLRADRQLVDKAAAQLRRRAILDGYAGLHGKAVAFGLALVLVLARNLRDLAADLRAQTVNCCRTLLHGPNRGDEAARARPADQGVGQSPVDQTRRS